MSLLKKIGIALLISAVTGWFVFFLGTKQATGRFIQWKSLGHPSDKIAKIVRTTIGSLTVETNSGKLYSCEISMESQCWKEVAEIPLAENTDCVPPKNLPRPLSNVVDLEQICSLSPGGMTETIYALRDDENIYVWHGNTGFGEWAWASNLFNFLAGAIIGLVSVLVFFLVRSLMRLR